MNNGDHVRFKAYEGQEYWQQGLLLRSDPFLSIGEIITLGGVVVYVPFRLIEVIQP